MASVFIPHWPSRIANEQERDEATHTILRDGRDSFEVRLADWSRKLLALQGYRISPSRSGSLPEPDIALHSRVLNTTLLPGLVLLNDGIQIGIQVGRCKCSFGQRLLGVLVWSRDATCSLEQQFAEDRHLVNHPVHIHSWDFRGGIASTRVHLYPHTLPAKRITLRMTFCHGPGNATSSRTKMYQLGVEVTVSEEVDASHLLEVQAIRERRLEDMSTGTYPIRPPTQQHTNAASVFLPPSGSPPVLQRTRSNSAPYAHPFDAYRDHQASANPNSQYSSHGAGEQSSNIVPRAFQQPEPNFLPSPPLTVENSISSDSVPQVPFWQGATQQHQSEREFHRQGQLPQSEVRPPPVPNSQVPSAVRKPANHRPSLWVPTVQPAGWDQPRTPLAERRRSSGDKHNSAHNQDSGRLHGFTKDGSYPFHKDTLPSGQPPVRPPYRSKSSDELAGGLRGPPASDPSHHGQSDILGEAQGLEIARSESPDQLPAGFVMQSREPVIPDDSRYYNRGRTPTFDGDGLTGQRASSVPIRANEQQTNLGPGTVQTSPQRQHHLNGSHSASGWSVPVHSAPQSPGNVESIAAQEQQPARQWSGAGNGQPHPRPEVWSPGNVPPVAVTGEGWPQVNQQRRPVASVLQPHSPAADRTPPAVVQPKVMIAPSSHPAPPQIMITSATPPLTREVLPSPGQHTETTNGTSSVVGDPGVSKRPTAPVVPVLSPQTDRNSTPEKGIVTDSAKQDDNRMESGKGHGIRGLGRALGSFLRRNRHEPQSKT